MKRFILSFLLIVPMLASAHNAKLFRYDAHKLSLQLVAVNQLDRYIEAQHATDGNFNIDTRLWNAYRTQSVLPDGKENKSWGSTSFIMGCLLGVIGVLLVYLITEDGHEVEKALWGMVASYVITGACVGLIFLSGATIAILNGE